MVNAVVVFWADGGDRLPQDEYSADDRPIRRNLAIGRMRQARMPVSQPIFTIDPISLRIFPDSRRHLAEVVSMRLWFGLG
jgi:hypothetical protein